ncbi:TPA: hypothetical protein DIC21_01570 [Candidatus Uhrbacteria bacterium]|nr:hypothetical protein [Candidatus Uhrbacteria bacterium]
MAEEQTTNSATEINPLDVWKEMGVIDALLPHIREVVPGFEPENFDIVFAYVTWWFDRSGCVGTFYLDEGEGEIELRCEPVSTRWRADPAKPTVAMVFRVLQQNNEDDDGDLANDDMTEGCWYAVPVGLAPTTVRSKSEKTFQKMGLLEGRLPGFSDGEWDRSQPRHLSLRFKKYGGIAQAWYNGRKVVFDRHSRKPANFDSEVACEVVCERLHKVFVTWRGVMTEGQQRVALVEASRLRGLTGFRRRTVGDERQPDTVTPALANLPEATGEWGIGTDESEATTTDPGTDAPAEEPVSGTEADTSGDAPADSVEDQPAA